DQLAQRAARTHGGSLLQFSKLDAAQAELSSIRDWYEQADAQGNVRILRRRQATEAAFRADVPKHPWLHLITHGYFSPASAAAPSDARAGKMEERVAVVDPGLLSGLAFAGANAAWTEGKDDGILTALEVSALDLSKVNTVVLSACETGLGQAAGGEGLLG